MTKTRGLAVVDLLLKLVLVAAVSYAALRTDLPRFHNKAMGLRAVLYPLAAVVVPVTWWVFGRRRVAYPLAVDIVAILPFLSDALGNVLDLYDSVTWFDDVLHLVNWLALVTAFGLWARGRPLGRLTVAALTLGFGAVTNILWEIGEYLSFITGNQGELKGIYRDTIGDLTLSLTGSLLGAILIATVLWPQRQEPAPASHSPAAAPPAPRRTRPPLR